MNIRFNPEVYKSYDRLQSVVLEALAKMVSSTRGSMLTFNAKKIADLAGLPTHPVVLTLIKDVIERLRGEGLVRRVSRSTHGVKYAIDRDSPLWRLAKLGEMPQSLDALHLREAVHT